jgi:hypothetical protein
VFTLTEIFDQEGSDKGSFFCHVGQTENLAHKYTYIYEQYMETFRDAPFNLLEIGICSPFYPGASLRAWYKYFTKAEIYGLDIVDCSGFCNDRVKTFIVDQTSKTQLTNFISTVPSFKFIIDDGCHDERAITISLGALFPVLESGGIYFIEDLHVVHKDNLLKLVDKKFYSPFISEQQLDYINANIASAVFSEDKKMCIIKKS